MASSFSNHYVCFEQDLDDEEYTQQGEEQDGNNGWEASQKLELGLALVSNSEQQPRSTNPLRRAALGSTSSPLIPLWQSPKHGGLGLGFQNGNVGASSTTTPSPGSNYYQHHGASSCQGPWHVESEPSGPRVQLQVQIPKTTGLWFTLRSAANRQGEILPQIPKAYIRVKEENVTILIVKKYLVTKLGLTNVAEIDISCMGQPLLHFQTLKYVRDVIWRPRLTDSLNAVASETSLNYLMPLHYGKHCPC